MKMTEFGELFNWSLTLQIIGTTLSISLQIAINTFYETYFAVLLLIVPSFIYMYQMFEVGEDYTKKVSALPISFRRRNTIQFEQFLMKIHIYIYKVYTAF